MQRCTQSKLCDAAQRVRVFRPAKPLKGQSQTLTHFGYSKLDTLPAPAESPSCVTPKQKNTLLNKQSNYQKQILFHICSWACEKNKLATILHLRNEEKGFCFCERQLYGAVGKGFPMGIVTYGFTTEFKRSFILPWRARKQNNLVKATVSRKNKQTNKQNMHTAHSVIFNINIKILICTILTLHSYPLQFN